MRTSGMRNLARRIATRVLSRGSVVAIDESAGRHASGVGGSKRRWRGLPASFFNQARTSSISSATFLKSACSSRKSSLTNGPVAKPDRLSPKHIPSHLQCQPKERIVGKQGSCRAPATALRYISASGANRPRCFSHLNRPSEQTQLLRVRDSFASSGDIPRLIPPRGGLGRQCQRTSYRPWFPAAATAVGPRPVLLRLESLIRGSVTSSSRRRPVPRRFSCCRRPEPIELPGYPPNRRVLRRFRKTPQTIAANWSDLLQPLQAGTRCCSWRGGAFPGATPFVHHSRAGLQSLIRVSAVAGLARF